MNYIIDILTEDIFQKDVLENELPVAVYFYSEDCPVCMAFSPVFDRMAEKYGQHMKFARIFRQQNRKLAEKYNVKSSPAVLFFKNGKEVCSRLTGYISKPEFNQVLDNVVEGACKTRGRQIVHCDVLILGAGPAGLSAAIYAARAKMNTIVVDEGIAGGQVATTFNVANYPGTNGVIRGTDLVGNMTRQALDFGSRIDDMKEIQKLELTGEEKHVTSEDTDYFVKCIIIATGAAPRKLPAEGERDFRGRGVHYCAACDGAMYQDADLLVAGGGNSAVEEAVFLTRYAKHVTVIHQLDHFQASKTAQDELFKNPGISVIWNSEIRRVFGDSFLKGAVVEDLKTGQQREINADGVFVYIGMQPRTDLFKGLLDLDEKGYIICDEDMNTSAAGVFAAGDVRVKRIRQIATAANDGVIAGLMAEKYINKRGN